MKFYTYDDYLHWKKYYATYSCTLMEDSLPYSISSQNSEELEETQINDIHDKSYRDLLKNKKEFSLFLKHFLGYNINSNLLQKFNNDFVTDDFKNRRSDIVYKIANKPVYIFIEHQSSIDYSMNYRIFEYYSLILRDTVEQDKLKNKSYKFPLIVPILLYTGTNKWKFVPNIKEKQFAGKLLGDKRLNFPYDFISIHNYSIEELVTSNSTVGYMMATDKCTSKDELYKIFDTLSNMELTKEQKKTIQRFLFFVFDKSFTNEIRNELIQKFNEGVDENMKCAWQYLIEDIRRDRAEGVAEGITKRSFEIIRNMLKNGESIDKIKLYTGFSTKQIKDIQREMESAV